VSTINRQPAGLLGFLGIKNFGRNPETLSANLAPTWDLSDLYLNSNPLYAEVTSTAAAAGYTICHTPPPGEIWYVMDGGVSFFSGAGISWTGHLARGSPNNVTTIPMGPIETAPATGRAVLWHSYPFILAPGENVGFFTLAVTGGATNFYSSIRYARLLA